MDEGGRSVVHQGGQKLTFGKPTRAHSLFDDNFVNINHGSFGAHPRRIQSRLHHYQNLAERRPDQFIRYDYPKLLDGSRDSMAKYMNCAVDEVVFAPNATTGVNTILRNLKFSQSDCIMFFSGIYGACEKTISYVCESSGARMAKIECRYPISDEELCNLFHARIRDTRTKGLDPKLALFDVISSLPGVRVPFERPVEICKSEGVLSLVDGAHAPGLVTLDLQGLQPDFFVGNCHKWLLAPRGCAILYVPTKHQYLIRSSIPTSHGFVPLQLPESARITNPLPPTTKSDFVNQFEFVGALDNSAYLCVPDCMDFIDGFCGGEETYRSYIVSLATKGGQRVAKILGTEVMDNKDQTLTRCAFSNVRLPVEDLINSSRWQSADEMAQKLTQILVMEHNTFLAVYNHGNAIYVRLSAQVYLDMQDFEWIGHVLNRLCEQLRRAARANI